MKDEKRPNEPKRPEDTAKKPVKPYEGENPQPPSTNPGDVPGPGKGP